MSLRSLLLPAAALLCLASCSSNSRPEQNRAPATIPDTVPVLHEEAPADTIPGADTIYRDSRDSFDPNADISP